MALDSEDRTRAGIEYEKFRRRLCRFFEWRGCSGAEDLADETLDRTARKLNEGTEIANLAGFVSGVARNVMLESFDNAKRDGRKLSDLAEIEHRRVPDEDERIPCFRDCLDQLPAEDSELLVDYYNITEGSKITHRKQMAKAIGETANALRIRVYRIRRKLDDCIRDCLDDAGLK